MRVDLLVVSFTWAKRCLGKDPAGLFEPQVGSRRVIVAHAVVMDAADSRCLRPMAKAAKRALGVDSFQIVANAGYSHGEQVLGFIYLVMIGHSKAAGIVLGGRALSKVAGFRASRL